MIGAIVAAEVGFWVLLVGGLLLCCVVRARRASTLALAAVPIWFVAGPALAGRGRENATTRVR